MPLVLVGLLVRWGLEPGGPAHLAPGGARGGARRVARGSVGVEMSSRYSVVNARAGGIERAGMTGLREELSKAAEIATWAAGETSRMR